MELNEKCLRNRKKKKKKKCLQNSCRVRSLLTFGKSSMEACQFPWHNAVFSVKISPWWSVVVLQICCWIESLVAGSHGRYSILCSVFFHPHLGWLLFDGQRSGVWLPSLSCLMYLCMWVYLCHYVCFGLLWLSWPEIVILLFSLIAFVLLTFPSLRHWYHQIRGLPPTLDWLMYSLYGFQVFHPPFKAPPYLHNHSKSPFTLKRKTSFDSGNPV